MRLKELDFHCPAGAPVKPLYEVIHFGVEPLQVLSEILIEEAVNFYDEDRPEESKVLFFAASEIEGKLKDLKETLERFDHQITGFIDGLEADPFQEGGE